MNGDQSSKPTRESCMRLTKPQTEELRRLAGGSQVTYGRYRTRVQNRLIVLGLARFNEVRGVSFCEITDAGKAVLRGR